MATILGGKILQLGFSVDFVVKRRAYQRSLGLTVKPCGEVLVTASKTAPLSALKRFVNKNKEWIVEAQGHYEKLRRDNPDHFFTEDEEFLFEGRKLPLRIEKNPRKRAHFALENEELRFYWHRLCVTGSERPQVFKCLHRFYRAQGVLALKKAVQINSEKMGLYPSSLSFRSQKTRWGSCSSEGAISLNWRLVAAPKEALDYVVIHELAHLRYQNHSKRFWALVESYCPDYRHWSRWLAKNTYSFDFLARKSELYGPRY